MLDGPRARGAAAEEPPGGDPGMSVGAGGQKRGSEGSVENPGGKRGKGRKLEAFPSRDARLPNRLLTPLLTFFSCLSPCCTQDLLMGIHGGSTLGPCGHQAPYAGI